MMQLQDSKHRTGSLGWSRRVVHELRWYLSDRDSLRERTNKLLNLNGYYWLFILGVNNSGTTLLEEILRSHPLIRTLPHEGQFLTRGIPNPETLHVSRAWSLRLDRFRWTETNKPMAALRAQYDWAAIYDARPGVLLEKSPPNTVRARWLQHHFRPCKFIAISRHPYAVCEGIRRRAGRSIETAAFHWSIAHRILLLDLEFLEHPFRLKYEDLCTDPDTHLRALSDFLALPTPLDHDLSRTIQGNGIDGQVQGLHDFNARSVERLSREDLDTINRIAGSEMDLLGYEKL
jgi:hypothetical protein